jgi:TonB family protein
LNRIPWLAVVALLPCLAVADDSKAQNEASDLVAHAAIRQGIRHAGEKPYVLRIQFSAEHIVPKHLDGQYEELWMSPDKWRRELVLSGFKQVEIGSGDSKWVTRNLDFSPRPAYLLEIALDAFIEPRILAEERVAAVRTRTSKGADRRCVELNGVVANSRREICFDKSGTLVSEEHLQQRFEFEDFVAYGEKIFPRTVRVYADDRMVLDFTAQGPSPLAEPKPELFRSEAGALQFAPCERRPAIPTNKIVPQYPREARNAHQQGTVTVYAVVAATGRVGRTKVLESAGQALDHATLDAVQQWTYPAANCGTQPLPTEIEIRVNYALSIQ